MRSEIGGDGDVPFRTGRFEPAGYVDASEFDEIPQWHRQSFPARLATVALWLVAALAIAILLTIAGVFLLFATSDEPADALRFDSPEVQRILQESVELDGCRYVDRMAEQVMLRFTNTLDQRLDHVVIQVRFVDGGEAFAKHEVNFVEIAAGETREAMVRDDRPAVSETDPLECDVGWVRVFETG